MKLAALKFLITMFVNKDGIYTPGYAKNRLKNEIEPIYNSIREIHDDYIDFFCEARDSLALKGKTKSAVKRRLISRRDKYSRLRERMRNDAHIILDDAEKIEEKRFLLAIIQYFAFFENESRGIHCPPIDDQSINSLRHNYGGGNIAFKSGSYRFINEIFDSLNEDELLEEIDDIISRMTSKFRKVGVYYRALQSSLKIL